MSRIKWKLQDTQGSKRHYPWCSETQWREAISWLIPLLEPANQDSKPNSMKCDKHSLKPGDRGWHGCDKFCWEHGPLVSGNEKGTLSLLSSSQRHCPAQLLEKQVSVEGTLQNAWPALPQSRGHREPRKPEQLLQPRGAEGDVRLSKTCRPARGPGWESGAEEGHQKYG